MSGANTWEKLNHPLNLNKRDSLQTLKIPRIQAKHHFFNVFFLNKTSGEKI